MEDWEEYNHRVKSQLDVLGADRRRIQRLIEKEELPEEATYRLSQLEREIDITMTGGWG